MPNIHQGGDSSQDLLRNFLASIPSGREGWVYLIHAEGTKRYKIGRSVNPVSRHAVLQGQSPYPLKIITCGWTVNSVNDEKWAHESLGKHRVYGEWFELELLGEDGKKVSGSLESARIAVEWRATMHELSHLHIDNIASFLGISNVHNSSLNAWVDIITLYLEHIHTVQSFNACNHFFQETLILLLKEAGYIANSKWYSSETTEENLDYFIQGAIRGFTASVLKLFLF